MQRAVLEIISRPGFVRTAVSAAMALVACSAVSAQQSRILPAVDDTRHVIVKGNIHPEASPLSDRGAVESGMKLGYLALLLKRSPRQQADLEQLLKEQQDPSSPLYRHWLTPEQYADRFGLSSSDIGKIEDWLRLRGFSIIQAARGRDFVAFSGTAEQIEQAFHTSIHRFVVDGQMHYANAAEPSIPEALSGVVSGFLGLDDFRPKPLAQRNQAARISFRDGSPHLDYTFQSGAHALTPGDLATIYNIKPLYSYGFDGRGQTIVVVGQTNVDLEDIRLFRKTFNLPAIDPARVLVKGSPDPGIVPEQLDEADLDLEWAGAVAKNATIRFVYSQSAVVSAAYAIDQALAPVITYSFGGCEPRLPLNLVQFLRSYAQKANAEGITWVAASGDSGAAACENQKGASAIATTGLSVNLPASIPEVTAVGGSEFSEGNGNYWGSKNGPDGGSALSYIPEAGWNDAALTKGGFAGSGGGTSIYFAKPQWQRARGVPNDGRRDVPDIALTASPVHDPYWLATNRQWTLIGGTSAAAPAFAGILVLLNQYLTSIGVLAQPGLGNMNPLLYWLSENTPEVFHDITAGSNTVACRVDTPNCQYGSMGYVAGPGYDRVTGLGSVDAYNLLATLGAVASRASARLPGNSGRMTAASSDSASAVVEPTRPVSLAAANTQASVSVFAPLIRPIGVATDPQGNVFTTWDKTFSVGLTEFSPAGTPVWQTQIGDASSAAFIGHIAYDSATGDLWDLTNDGRIAIIHPSAGTFSLTVLSLLGLRFDTSAIYDVQTGLTGSMSFIQPNFSHYRDISLLRRGNVLDVIVSGSSYGFPFIARLRLTSSGWQARVLAATHVQFALNSSPRGVAVNSAGQILTTMPVLLTGEESDPPDRLIAFSIDFPERKVGLPRILSASSAGSVGMDVDSVGNFYVATGVGGSALCTSAGSGALLVLSRSLETYSCAAVSSGLYLQEGDVAVTRNGAAAYISLNGLNAIARVQFGSQ